MYFYEMFLARVNITSRREYSGKIFHIPRNEL
jgi:hypothetical protein